MKQVATDRFFAYVKRRRALMAIGGLAAMGVGAAGIAVSPGGTGAGLGVLVLFGLFLVLGAGAGASMLREGELLTSSGPAVQMDLMTWPYRTVRSPVKNRVLVTLDVPGSTERTPLAEFKPIWYTPGSVNEPTRSAEVFGTIERGRTLLAVAEDGSCYLGRVSRVRPDR